MAKERKRLSVPLKPHQGPQLDELAEAVGPGVTATNVAVMALSIGLPLLENIYRGRALPSGLESRFQIELEIPRGRGRPKKEETLPVGARDPSTGEYLNAGDEEIFETKRTQPTIAKLAARAKALGFKIVDAKKDAGANDGDPSALERIISPTPIAPAQVPGQKDAPMPASNVAEIDPGTRVTGQPIEKGDYGEGHPLAESDDDSGLNWDELPKSVPEMMQEADSVTRDFGDPLPDGMTAVDWEMQRADESPQDAPQSNDAGDGADEEDDPDEAPVSLQEAIKAKLAELIEAGVPVEDAYEMARQAAHAGDEDGAEVTELFPTEASPDDIDPMKCTHGVRWDAEEPCQACQFN